MNRLFLLLFGMVTFVAHAQVPDYVPTEGLVGWYPLDGDAVDASASNEAGELNGVNEAENRFNEPNTALQFEGAISFVNLGLENFLSLTEDDTLSLAAWAMPEADGSGAGVLISKYQNINLGSSWLVGYEPPYGFRIFGDGTSGTPYPADWSSQCPNDPSGWSHLAVVFQGGSCVFWLNGQFICESTFPVSSLSQEQPVLLGRSNCPDEQLCTQFSGKLDDVGFWNRALTEEEILALYNAPAPTPGCTDPTACNYDAEAMSDDGGCIPSGCMEPLACNYNALAECGGEACDYACCPGPGCCADGTSWDYDLEQCVPADSEGDDDTSVNSCPQDLDFDGVVGVGDLMDLLSVFGSDCPTNFTCGDPVNYHGYDYATVQIGEQCWFAENLRAEQYLNGDSIPGNLNDDAWTNATEGAQAILNENEENLELHGRLYNFYAVLDERGLCPAGWHVPADEEWITLGEGLGGIEVAGAAMKNSESDTPPWDGTNSSHWNGTPGGKREMAGWYGGNVGYWWTSTPYGCGGWHRNLHPNLDALTLSSYCNVVGFSVRCLKDQ